MLTVGVDLSAEPANTALAPMQWTAGSAQVQALAVGADDAMLVNQIAAADKAGIDCPLGWPQRFVEFVGRHQAGVFVAPVEIGGRDWRRRLALGEADLANTAVRHQLVDTMAAKAPWLRLDDFADACRRSDHALDAVIAALNARAAALGRASTPSVEHAAAARTEGWIALPIGTLTDLTHEDSN